MQTIEMMWAEAQAHMMPKGAGEVQKRDCKMFFMAGIKAILDASLEMAEMPDEKACDELEGLHKQIEEYRVKLMMERTR